MSLVYRAIWQDDRADLFGAAEGSFMRWTESKYGNVVAVEAEPVAVEVDGTVVTTERREVVDGHLAALEMWMTEERSQERWMTRLRVLCDGDGKSWLWVDLERVASDMFRRQDVAAPNLVKNLIKEGFDGGGRPRIGPAPLAPNVAAVRTGEVDEKIIRLMNNPERTTPLVVFSHDETLAPRETMDRAQATSDILAGVATVVALPPDAQAEFQSTVGPDLSVWGGGARVYLPGDLDPSRHRYLPKFVVERGRREAGRRIAHMLSGPIAARRAPDLYERIRPALRSRTNRSDSEMLALVELELIDRNEAIDDLREQAEFDQERILADAATIEELNVELDTQRDQVRKLQYQYNQDDASVARTVSLPSSALSLTEAAEFCRRHLDGVILHSGACVDLEELDTAVESEAWGRTSWRAFRALHAYAKDAGDFDGGFWQWCDRSMNLEAWTASAKKLAMSESETVTTSRKLMAQRTLPIDSEVDQSGRIKMEAHMKIAEGGGPNIPRIYFYDDTGGVTGKVHVGFFGPHSYMSNTKT